MDILVKYYEKWNITAGLEYMLYLDCMLYLILQFAE